MRANEQQNFSANWGLTIPGRGLPWRKERFYLPRSEWIWDRELNPELTAMATLRAHLLPNHLPRNLLQAWTAQYRPDPDAQSTFLSGGAGISIEDSGTGLVVIFTSGGQDALESLTAVVQEFHDRVLHNQPCVEVLWEELPLSFSRW